jgi:hypothetical protein
MYISQKKGVTYLNKNFAEKEISKYSLNYDLETLKKAQQIKKKNSNSTSCFHFAISSKVIITTNA